MMIKETPNKIIAVLKVTATAEFFDDEASEETVRYAIEQDLEDAGFDVDVALLKEQEPMMVRLTTSTIRCPKCNKQMTNRGALHKEIKYCWRCGQAVRWE